MKEPDFPIQDMMLRDYFAIHFHEEDVRERMERNLSHLAKVALVGRPKPVEPESIRRGLGLANEDEVRAHHIACLEWECEVAAHVRYRMAEAMLKARK